MLANDRRFYAGSVENLVEMTRRAIARGVIASAAVGGAIAFGAPAQAAEAPSSIQPLGTAPTCVHLSVDAPGIVTKTVRLTNNCSYVVRVRVDISFAPDLPCISMSSGQRASWKVARNAVVAGVNNC